MRLLLAAASVVSAAHAYMGAVMGKLTDCDDAKSNLEVDWDPRDFTQFTCGQQLTFPVDDTVDFVHYSIPNLDPRNDPVYHKCMNETILYKNVPPLRGNHRPNWGQYGEYLYIPPQRWLHNLEHGSIILLYHPCVDPAELQKLRQIVTGCLYRHVITPYNKLDQSHPLGLVAWGSKLMFNQVDETQAVEFIRKHAHVAPEDLFKQGQYTLHLIHPAEIVSDKADGNVCPHHPGNGAPKEQKLARD